MPTFGMIEKAEMKQNSYQKDKDIFVKTNTKMQELNGKKQQL